MNRCRNDVVVTASLRVFYAAVSLGMRGSSPPIAAVNNPTPAFSPRGMEEVPRQGDKRDNPGCPLRNRATGRRIRKGHSKPLENSEARVAGLLGVSEITGARAGATDSALYPWGVYERRLVMEYIKHCECNPCRCGDCRC
jgi:hypothetical protein